MKSWLKSSFKKIIKRKDTIPSLINVYLSKSSLLFNLNQFRTLVPDKAIAPVLKGNAYGHGIKQISYLLKDEKVPFFIIDSYFEAKAIRNEGMRTPLLIVGYSNTNSISGNTLKNISFTITSIEALEELSIKINKKIKIHLKIDTGMHRQGILFHEIDNAIKIINHFEFGFFTFD